MVNFCAVFGCSNTAKPGVQKSFFRIPAVITTQGEKTEELSRERRKAWIAALCRADLKTTSLYQYRIFVVFISGSPSKLYYTTSPDWIPTVKMGHDKFKLDLVKNNSDRYQRKTERASKRKRTKVAETQLELQTSLQQVESLPSEAVEDDTLVFESNTVVSTVQTDIGSLQKEMQRLTIENMVLKKEISNHQVTPDAFKDNDEKVKYFTGLPNFLVLMSVFKFVSASLKQNERTSFCEFQQLIMTFMRLRLNMPMSLLSPWFRVSPSTISRTYANVINVMYVKFKCLIHWPEREELQKTMPMDFCKHFKTNVAIIIDCFEIFIERPSNLKATAMTWSSYKHNNTVKYLIGIVPQGVISYISKGWGGGVSDKYLTEHCDLLDKLLPGDTVIADRGFDIADSVESVCAKLVLPASTRGKKGLSALEVEKTRRIAHFRILVERVIGSLREKYTFFNSVIPVDHLICPPGDIPMLDKEVITCCAMINLNESVIPFN
uniref:Uncharacterized LOC114473450 n=1 Tax=Gouania willdenowi TaxID=441366 RepID=A0A8C5GX67_GOUWI